MNVCQKTALADDKIVSRDCGLDIGRNEECVKSNQAGLDATLCFCKTDLCNGSPNTSPSKTAATLMAIVAMAMASAFCM